MFLLFSVDLFSHMTFIATCEKTNKIRDISWNHLAKKTWRDLWATRNTLVVWSDPHIELLPYLYTCTIDSNLKLLLYHCIYIYTFLNEKAHGIGTRDGVWQVFEAHLGDPFILDQINCHQADWSAIAQAAVPGCIVPARGSPWFQTGLNNMIDVRLFCMARS